MTTPQDTGKFRTNTKDQFYTRPDVAHSCVQTILTSYPETLTYRWIEPSAGSGAFLQYAPAAAIGLDIDPQRADILKQDYLTWAVPASAGPTIVFGNPPFGRQSAMAKAFIAKSCGFADMIAFILPKSFTKPSMSRAFAPTFHCVYSADMPKNAFVLNGSPYDVPCVFQIWQRRAEARPPVIAVEAVGFQYVKDGYDLAVRRVGALAGRAYPAAGGPYSVQSHYFLKLGGGRTTDASVVTARLNAHEFPSNTVGPRSLSKSEINEVLNRILAEMGSAAAAASS
jgi:hypothetical protein